MALYFQCRTLLQVTLNRPCYDVCTYFVSEAATALSEALDWSLFVPLTAGGLLDAESLGLHARVWGLGFWVWG